MHFCTEAALLLKNEDKNPILTYDTTFEEYKPIVQASTLNQQNEILNNL